MSNTYCFRKSSKPGWRGQKERWVEDMITNTLNCFEFDSDVRTPEIVCITDTQRMPSISFQERAGCEGGGKGILIQTELVCALRIVNSQFICAERDY